MSTPSVGGTSRREFVKQSGSVLAGATVLGMAVPHVHAAEDNTLRVALIGCGGRGTGAAANALSVKNGPIKLVAMADVFPNKLAASHSNLKAQFESQVDVPDDHKFIGFDGYQKAMECLRPGDIVICATPPAFRWVQFSHAIDKGLHMFMEKPTTVDGPSTRKMLDLAKKSRDKNLKVGVGLMCRHCEARGELAQRVKNGELGEILLMRAYRQQGPIGTCFVPPQTGNDMSEVLYQIKNFHGFLWASGGCYSDFLVHNIDECCWIKDAWPVKAQGAGGRHYRGDYIDQNFDTYSVEYTFADGTKLRLEGRNVPGCRNEFASYAHGTKGLAVISNAGHWPSKARIYKGQTVDKDQVAWSFGPEKYNPYQAEWDHLVAAIRSDMPYNEAERGAIASLVTSMGRMACHTGQEITYDQILNSDHEFAPTADKLTMDGPAPVRRGSDGKYPLPMPGLTTKREYEGGV